MGSELSLTIDGRVRVQEILAHLYVLLPVLDDESTIGSAPYLMHRGRLRAALAQLADDDPDSISSQSCCHPWLSYWPGSLGKRFST